VPCIPRRSAGKEFQAAGPAYKNARSPNIVRGRGVVYSSLSQLIAVRFWFVDVTSPKRCRPNKKGIVQCEVRAAATKVIIRLYLKFLTRVYFACEHVTFKPSD